VVIEELKQIVRVEADCKIMIEKSYISISEKLQSISKEAVGWDKYLNKNSQQRELL